MSNYRNLNGKIGSERDEIHKRDRLDFLRVAMKKRYKLLMMVINPFYLKAIKIVDRCEIRGG
jgi:hypothetical protein